MTIDDVLKKLARQVEECVRENGIDVTDTDELPYLGIRLHLDGTEAMVLLDHVRRRDQSNSAASEGKTGS